MKAIYKKGKLLIVTGVTVLALILVASVSYVQVQEIVWKNSLLRLEEGVQTVVDEIQSMVERDTRILKATAELITDAGVDNLESTIDTLRSISPLLKVMNVRLLLPNDQIVTPSGNVIDVSQKEDFSFQKEFQRGEHLTDRVVSVENGELILRNMLPIIKDGRPVALLYGAISLKKLPQQLSIRNIYNGKASTYIIDTRTGNFILDTWHDKLLNVADMDTPDRETRGGTSWHEYTDSMLALGRGLVIYRTPRLQGWEYMYYGPAGVNDWSISISVPESEVFSLLWQIRRVAAIVALLMAAALALYIFFLYHQMKERAAEAVEQALLSEKLRKAEAADRAKTTFLFNISHDIRTPMTAILGFTTLAKNCLDNPSRLKDYLAKILSSGNHLLSLINDILDMSCIEAGKLEINEKPCSLAEIFQEIRDIIQNQVREKQLAFSIDAEDVTDEDILCDRLHLNQILLNVLSNAVKFTPEGGSVAVTVRQRPGAPAGYASYEIRIKDTGIGISPDFIRDIFKPFERERTSTVSGIQGSGLGMAITKRIVDAMGGTIAVESEPGHGSEFIIGLDFRLQPGAKPPAALPELAGRRALIVDETLSTRKCLTAILAHFGLRTEDAASGEEALTLTRNAAAAGDAFSLCITSWTLPGAGGPEIVRRFHSLQPDALVIATSFDCASFEEEAKQSGAAAVCNNPFFLSVLRDALSAALGAPKVEPVREEEAPDPLARLHGLRLLLVEDNELNREITQEILEEAGFIVDTAGDGTEAVSKVRSSPPGHYALVLMDVQMPVMNGYEATRTIRALNDPQLAAVPIVAFTANAFEEDKKQALSCGMNAHVAKPIDVSKLMAVLTRLLDGQSPQTDES
ncbi:response regulator [uncultured Mailhella sp.]|uniref:hybrid sensor histidine kinase/response regulator n=1 Tax=uncultured Mailhella sp. TaxID=1981031 RepID=UPI0026390229|nr:response regulator [uncultured Mailhella sp.]